MAHHKHKCRRCLNDFLCGENATECFNTTDITCDDCYWRVDFKWFVLVLILGCIAIWMTLFVVGNLKSNEQNGTRQSETKVSVPAEKLKTPASPDSR